ncbi:hypothetical protein Tco_1285205 [Tanacetum coccineum]
MQIDHYSYFCNSDDTTEGRMKDTESSTFHVLANALIVRSCQTLLCGLLRISPSNGVVPQSPVHTTSLDNLKHQLTTCSNRLKLRTVTRRHARSISSTADSLGASSTFRSDIMGRGLSSGSGKGFTLATSLEAKTQSPQLAIQRRSAVARYQRYNFEISQ